jgi:hypothetical protein
MMNSSVEIFQRAKSINVLNLRERYWWKQPRS